MAIRDFREKDIRDKIIQKVDPKLNHGKHDKGYIYIDKKIVAKIKIPNSHDRIMHKNKSKYIARDLKLDDEQFNGLIDCTLKGDKYYEILRDKIFGFENV